jgi:hypothetical protein
MTAQLVIHADRYVGRPIGSPTVLAMPREVDPVQVAAAAWAVLVDPTRWSTTLVGTDEDRALYAVRRAVPEVERVFGEVALRAGVGRRLGPGTCRWCLAPLIAQVLDQPEPPFDPAHRRLLGDPCTMCATRMRDRALAAVTAVTAGLPAAKSCRRCGGAHRWAPARAVTASARPRAATGVIWPAGRQPPREAGALVAAAQTAQLQHRAAQMHRAARRARGRRSR